jgi:ABC-type nitrate/sulfonate/bicarbonate transport system substrate-binding protein
MDAGSVYKLPNGGMSTTLTKIKQNPTEVRKVVRAVVLATKFFVDPQNKVEVTKYLTRVSVSTRAQPRNFIAVLFLR